MTDRDIANQIWLRLKNKPLPDTYTDKDADDIIRRYWHKVMESEQCYYKEYKKKRKKRKK